MRVTLRRSVQFQIQMLHLWEDINGIFCDVFFLDQNEVRARFGKASIESVRYNSRHSLLNELDVTL
jgi:hypothetical protein